MDKKKIDETLKKSQKKKILNSELHKGKVSWGEDALNFQKKLRNEWGI